MGAAKVATEDFKARKRSLAQRDSEVTHPLAKGKKPQRQSFFGNRLRADSLQKADPSIGG